MLRMDARAQRHVKRELAELPDVEMLRRTQESWVAVNWPVERGSWTTALREEGVLRFYREDF